MIVFVAGVHGVGKTYLGAPVANQLGMKHATASQLIREERGLESWTSDKCVGAIDENQAALISAVQRLRESGQHLLLDGHFVLRESKGEHKKIDPQVFADLKLDAVVLIAVPPIVILKRLAERGDTTWTVQELLVFMNRETRHARHVAEELGVPLHALFAPSDIEFRQAVESELRLGTGGGASIPDIRKVPKTILAYQGELEWVGPLDYSPLIIDSLEIRNDGRVLVIEFRSLCRGKNDGRPFGSVQRADIIEGKSSGESSSVPGILRGRPKDPMYETEWFELWPDHPGQRIRLQLKIRELFDQDGDPVCLCELCWIGKNRDRSEGHGLLRGKVVAGRPWDK